MDAPSTGPTLRGQRRPRISLQAMLMVVLCLGCSLGWLVHRARVQRAAVNSVERIRGEVLYEWEYKDGKCITGGHVNIRHGQTVPFPVNNHDLNNEGILMRIKFSNGAAARLLGFR